MIILSAADAHLLGSSPARGSMGMEGELPLSGRRKERRAHPRYCAELEVHGEGAGGVEATMVTENLSMGGVYCTSPVDFPEMTRLAIRLPLPANPDSNKQEVLRIGAVVVRREEVSSGNCRPNYMLALLFTEMDEETGEILARFLARQDRERDL